MTPSLLKAISQFTALPLPDAHVLEQGAGELNPLGAYEIARRMTPADLERRFQTGDLSFDGRVAFGINAATRIGAETRTWSQQILWGDRVIDGDWVEFYHGVWGNQILWGDQILWLIRSFGVTARLGRQRHERRMGQPVVVGRQPRWGDRVSCQRVGPPPF